MRQYHSSWTYRRLDHEIGVETSEWLGSSSPALSAHFHEETQISVVNAGHRVFQIGQQCFQIAAGQFAVIPAGIPHISRGCGGVATKSRDIFIDPAKLAIEGTSSIFVGSVSHPSAFDADETTEELLNTIAECQITGQRLALNKSLPAELVTLVRESPMPIKAVAARSSLSREGFIRRFAREYGMTPHAYRVAYKATQARALLRDSLSPAAAAYECGFADQSHLGRVFQRNFGTTPGSYRRAWQI